MNVAPRYFNIFDRDGNGLGFLLAPEPLVVLAGKGEEQYIATVTEVVAEHKEVSLDEYYAMVEADRRRAE